MNRKKIIISLLINILILIFEIIGLILSVQRHGIKVFQYYTENSNYFTLVASLLFCICSIITLKTNKLYAWTYYLRYISTTCLTITLVIVLVVLIPMFPNTALFLIFGNSNLYQHTLCPILSIVSFLYFENVIPLNKNSIFISLIPTSVYGIICIALNLLKIILGPYPFFYFYEIPWYYSTLSILGVFLISLVISYGLNYFYNRPFRQTHHIKKFTRKKA